MVRCDSSIDVFYVKINREQEPLQAQRGDSQAISPHDMSLSCTTRNYDLFVFVNGYSNTR